MSNIFSGGSHGLDLSNGATAGFIDVLMLAVSDLAPEDWGFRFSALLGLQDQNVMGRGAVGSTWRSSTGCDGAETRPREGLRAACHSTRGERTSLE
ncbi:hypothetical protein [Streptomyces sp. ALI-76-A]|uniref:hypothetical protein n=1 Tax=Streptomyces sp. ALI-76-A TaxID=3025736 RepID=UPI00256F3040|nr:hypothetical protein [Streptomyces sp. ALI-76-A]MDL5206112.1 hypothetical protein [Streptomyces sp. ALI-76-A]